MSAGYRSVFRPGLFAGQELVVTGFGFGFGFGSGRCPATTAGTASRA